MGSLARPARVLVVVSMFSLFAVGAGGCKKSTSSSDAAPTPAIAQVALSAKLVRGGSTPDECPEDGQTLTIGDVTTPTLIENGGTNPGGGGVVLSCKVASQGTQPEAGPSFDTSANVRITGSPGSTNDGSFLLTSQVDVNGLGNAGGVQLVVDKQDWTASGCILSTGSDQGEGVSAGSYAATIKCPATTSIATGHTCDIQAELRVEGCAEQE